MTAPTATYSVTARTNGDGTSTLDSKRTSILFDSPPKITRITYRLQVVTDESPQRLDLLYRNVTRHGTIYNTLAAVCEVTGSVVGVPTNRDPRVG